MQSEDTQSCLGLAGGRAPPPCYILMAQVLQLWAVMKKPSAQLQVWFNIEEERNVCFSHAGEPRHPSGEC